MLNIENIYGLNQSVKPKNSFSLHLVAIFILCAINIVYNINWNDNSLAFNSSLWNPMWMLLGPALFFSHKSIKLETITARSLLNLVPFIIFGLIFVFLAVGGDGDWTYYRSALSFYQIMFVMPAISMASYAVFSLKKASKAFHTDMPDANLLVISLSIVYLLITLIFFTTTTVQILELDWKGFDFRYITYGLLFFGSLMLICYWIFGDRNMDGVKPLDIHLDNIQKGRSALTDELARDYKERIISYFELKKAYLDPNITIDLLSNELRIPKHDFSTLFTVYFQKSFHNCVAEYRITHAISLLNENRKNIKIESLASSCGFNSKAAFFKHFKDKTGVTPAEYRLTLSKKSS